MKKLSLLLFFGIVLIVSCDDSKKKEQAGDEKATSEESADIKELSDSPRHHEWVDLKHGDRTVKAFVVYPERKEKAKPILVIHENRGLNDWARVFADELAGKGYLVIAPDLISNTVPGKELTSDMANPDEARTAIYRLDPEQVTEDLDAAYEYIQNDSASTGDVAVVGFCWGGSQTFRYATHNPDITSAHVFYGTAPEEDSTLAKIEAPVYGYYGGNDNRVNSTIEMTDSQMKELGKKYEYEIYDNAGHAFMRAGHEENGEPGNKKAHDQAWKRLLSLLK